jgi:hypothetical protein
MVKAAVAAATAAATKVPGSSFRRNSGLMACSHAQAGGRPQTADYGLHGNV